MKTPFVKMHGNGNDFVIIDNIKQNFRKDITLIKKIANRRIGIGCDQLILIEKSDDYDAFMRIYNNDGSEAEMCGNAARCVASLLMAGTKKTEICIETNSTLLNASLEKNNEISVINKKIAHFKKELNKIKNRIPTESSDEEELDVYEEEINGKTYYITDGEKNYIYEKLKNGEIGDTKLGEISGEKINWL